MKHEKQTEVYLIRANATGPMALMRRWISLAAIVSAGQQRLMPIFLTTATTVGGLVLLALGSGRLWVGVAGLLMAGLTIAILLKLIIIPVLYSLLFRTIKLSPESPNDGINT